MRQSLFVFPYTEPRNGWKNSTILGNAVQQREQNRRPHDEIMPLAKCYSIHHGSLILGFRESKYGLRRFSSIRQLHKMRDQMIDHYYYGASHFDSILSYAVS